VKLKRLLGAENGWGGAAGTLLLLGFGAVLLVFGVAGLRDAARVKPEERVCADWLANPSGAKWVTLTGCTLDVAQARAEEGRVLVPIAGGGLLSTTDTELLALKDAAESKPLTGLFESGVLVQSKQPERAKTVVSLLVGLVAIALVVRSVFMRFLIERDSTL
jgi:hypothetical protein